MKSLASFIAAVVLIGSVDAQTRFSPSNQVSGPPRESNYEDVPFGDIDRATSPEQKLGEILKRNWAIGNSLNCQPSLPYHARLDCIEKTGFSLRFQYPAACKISLVERRPAPVNLRKRWDGTVEGSYLMPREIVFDLTTLLENNITTDPLVELYFALTKAKMPAVRVIWSDHPNDWVTLVPPPLKEEYDAEFPTAAERERAFKTAADEWSQKIAPVALFQGDKHSFELSPQYLKITMSPMGLLWFSSSDGGALSRAAQGKLVDTLKAVLSKCRS